MPLKEPHGLPQKLHIHTISGAHHATPIRQYLRNVDLWRFDNQVFICPQDTTIEKSPFGETFERLIWRRASSTFAECSEADFTTQSERAISRSCVPCEALYGVLRIAQCNILLFISQTKPAGTAPHCGDILEIKRLNFWELPLADTEDPNHNAAATRISSPPSPPELSEHVVKRYIESVRRFCNVGCNSSTASGMYCCFSFNMAHRHRSPQAADSNVFTTNSPSDRRSNSSAESIVLASATVFQWNLVLISAFPHNSAGSKYVVPVTRGFVGSSVIDGGGVTCTLICRLSSRNAGTRYNRRGVCTSGYAANFSETEQLVWRDETITSFVVCRGSVPLCWTQPANLKLQPEVTVGAHVSPLEDFRRHLQILTNLYGLVDIHCLDLMSHSIYEEEKISVAFSRAVAMHNENPKSPQSPPRKATSFAKTSYVGYNMSHVLAKSSLDELSTEIDGLVKTKQRVSCWTAMGPSVTQSDVVRVNCLDCLDRSNVAQCALALCAAREQRTMVGAQSDHLLEALKVLWSLHGDALAYAYAGSPAHFSDLILKGHTSFKTSVYSVKLSLNRFVQQNFFDGTKQDAISLLTTAHDPQPVHSKNIYNPFQRRLTFLNALILTGFVLTLAMFSENALSMLVWGPSMHGVMLQTLWAIVLSCAVVAVRREGESLTNFPLLN